MRCLGRRIKDVEKGFTRKVNHFFTFRKTFVKKKINIKIIKNLNRSCRPKVIIISNCRDFTMINITTLFDKLRAYKLKLERLNEKEK